MDDEFENESTHLPHNGTDTSRAAAVIAEPAAQAMRLRMLRLLVQLRPAGTTSDGAQGVLGGIHQSTSQRFGEMAADGLCEETDEVRATRYGCPAFVWKPTDKGVKAIEEGWYTGEILDPAAQKAAREARPSLRFVLEEAFRRLRSCGSDDDLAWIAKMKQLTKQRARAKFPRAGKTQPV
jgi:hypothetical protein